ncbi:MAG: MFS transporter [Candidatus Dormibacteraeota bacterium]|nr:MFS transporter [Candidatus Dormibacteraeota bacterium]
MGRYRWVVLGGATLMQVGVSLPQQTPAAIGPVLIASLHISNAQLGLLTSAIWGGMLLGFIPFGLLVDRFGERRVLAGGALLLAVALGAASMASTFWPLFLLLIPAAVGASSGSPGGARPIAEWFPRSQRGMALGIRQGGVTLAGITAATTLPAIALAAGWRAAFWTVAAAAVVAVAIFAVLYREPVGGRAESASLDPRALLSSRRFLAATAFGWVFMGILGAGVTYLPNSLHQSAGLSVIVAGRLLAVLQLGGLVGRVGWGLVSDRAGRALTMAVTGLLACVACLGMAWLGHAGTPLVFLGGISFLLGLSAMGWNALYIAIAAEAVPIHHAASAIGIGTAITFTGMFVGAPLYGLLADRSGGFTVPWVALAAWGLLGVLFLAAGHARRPQIA